MTGPGRIASSLAQRIATGARRASKAGLIWAGLGLAMLAPLPALAQSADLFRPVVRVNESIVTRFELEQRMALMEVLGSPEQGREVALNQLIDDRLKEQAARFLGLEVGPEQVALGVEDFAARGNLSPDELFVALSQAGIEPETLRAFVRVGVAWRIIVRQRFSAQAQVSEDELDRALSLGTGEGNVRVLLSEIILPMTPQLAGLSRQQADAIANMTSIEDFAAAARQVSIAPTAINGGRLDWLPLSQLPPAVAPLFLSLKPGEVTPPVPLPGGEAIALFQLRQLQDGRPSIARNMNLDYLLLRLTAEEQGPQLLAQLRQELGNGGCDALYTRVSGASETRLERVEAERSATAGSLAGVIDQIDPGELALLPGGRAIVMLCGRTAVLGEDLSRDDLRQRLLLRNLEDLGEGFLAELRASATITRP